jgi:hypothetical protein
MHGFRPSSEYEPSPERRWPSEWNFGLIALLVLSVLAVAAAFTSRSVDHTGSIAKTVETPKTLSPYEIHLNYKSIKELPVNEVKEPF